MNGKDLVSDMKTMTRNAIVGLCIVLGANILGAQTITCPEVRGDGSWKTDRVSLDLQRGENGTLTGLITISDSPLFAAGRIRGTLEGNVISGTITGEQGDHVARFNGGRRPVDCTASSIPE